MKFLQKLGKSLMLPIAVLPICGILMGIGYWMCPASMQGNEIVGVVEKIGFWLVKAGGAIIDNMSLLFAIGVSVGMSDDNHGASCLSGLVSYLVLTTLLSTTVMSVLTPGLDPDGIRYAAFSKIQNPFIAILCGILGAECYNRFRTVKLPDYLSFFSGRRFVIIASAFFSIILSAVLALVWPVSFNALVMAGRWILKLGGVGVGIYAFLNRLLIPFGLHHALNSVFWFDTIGIGDLTSFWAGRTSADVGWSLGMYMSGFFPCMMFGIPGAGFAMIKNSKNRKVAAGILIPTMICAFICGITEPFEFSFMFMAFPLYVIYSLLYGIFAAVTYFTGFRAGFSFSAGFTDLLFSASLPAAKNTWLIIPLGAAAFVVFYLVFDLILQKFAFQIPGDEPESEAQVTPGVRASGDRGYETMAEALLTALGGRDNLTDIDCCATRLRLGVRDSGLIDHNAIKRAGAIASKSTGKDSCQIIIGTTVQQVCDALKEAARLDAESPVSPESVKPAVNGPVTAGRKPVFRGDVLHFSAGNSFDAVITDGKGIHARVAAVIADAAKKHGCEITVAFGGSKASAKSITELMSLGITCGSTVTVTASGDGARDAVIDMTEVFSAIADIM